jgi:hypothetical protein
VSEHDTMTREELHQEVLRWNSKYRETRAALRNVMALVGGYPETIPSELGLQAWRSVKTTAEALLSTQE